MTHPRKETSTSAAGPAPAMPDPAVITRCLYTFFYHSARIWYWIVASGLAFLAANITADAVPFSATGRAAVWLAAVILLNAGASLLAGTVAAAVARLLPCRITRDPAWQKLFGPGITGMTRPGGPPAAAPLVSEPLPADQTFASTGRQPRPPLTPAAKEHDVRTSSRIRSQPQRQRPSR